MPGFIFRRLLATIPVLVMVAIIVFSMLRLTPGDPAAIIAGDSASPGQLEAIRTQLGLDQPILTQFLIWSGNLLRGDLGRSFFFKTDVTTLIGQRLEPTLSLALLTMAITLAVSIPLGVIAASRQGSLTDRLIMGFAVMGFSVPVFVIGYALIYLFAVELKWLPVQGYADLADGLWPWLERLILPSLTLSVIYIALIARIARTSVLEVLGQDHVRTARAKGVSRTGVLVHHALRNAAIPIVTVIGLGVGLLIGGVVVTESVFNIPGLGRLTVDAVLSRDFPTIQAIVLLFSVVYVLINLVVDISYVFLDPRIRY